MAVIKSTPEEQQRHLEEVAHEHMRELQDEILGRRVADTIRRARGDRPRAEVAALLGVHPNTLANFERGDRTPDAIQIARLCRLYNLNPASLLDLDDVEDTAGEFVSIPGLAVHASTGGGAVVDGEDEVGRFAFRRAWISKRGLNPSTLRVVTARGDSMEPTIRRDDILLVDSGVDRLGADGIYLIDHEGELKCKRLQALIDGSVAIRSDNPRYGEERLQAGQAEQLLRVVAKVVWIGGER